MATADLLNDEAQVDEQPTTETTNATTQPEPTPQERVDARLRKEEEIFEQRAQVREAERELADAKEELKAAKECLDGRQSYLNSLIDQLQAIRDGRPIQRELPLESGDDGQSEDVAGKELISVLGLPNGTLEKLQEADIETIKDLEMAMADGKIIPGRIKGIGESAIDRITDALEKFRSEHSVPVPTLVADEAPAVTEE